MFQLLSVIQLLFECSNCLECTNCLSVCSSCSLTKCSNYSIKYYKMVQFSSSFECSSCSKCFRVALNVLVVFVWSVMFVFWSWVDSCSFVRLFLFDQLESCVCSCLCMVWVQGLCTKIYEHSYCDLCAFPFLYIIQPPSKYICTYVSDQVELHSSTFS